MATENLTEFNLPVNAYATFDATSIKRLIIDRLNQNSLFSDQNFEGSNLSALIDLQAFLNHTLLFYLNQTATESMFSESQLYENINRISKTIDYKPTGNQTSLLSFNAIAPTALAKGTYSIPRFSYINANGVFYSFKEDVTFSKTTTDAETLTQFQRNNLLFQGQFEQYPTITAAGDEFERVVLLPGDDIIVDTFNIFVYVKDIDTQEWAEWKRVSSLFLEDSSSKAFEVRLNENKHYEVKFGDSRTGKLLNNGDTVTIFFLKSNGSEGQVGPSTLNSNALNFFRVPGFLTIFDEVKDSNVTYLTEDQAKLLQFTNTVASTEYYAGETADEIRDRAPNTFSSQYRLVTKGDYEAYITQNFSNLIKDVKVVNNADYIEGHLKYLADDVGINQPNSDANVLYNQVLFADSCDFNNTYIYAVPKIETDTSYVIRNNYLTPSQKSEIIFSLKNNKSLTAETIMMDPVYVACSVALLGSGEIAAVDTVTSTTLEIVKDDASRKSDDQIKDEVNNIMLTYFNGLSLGSAIGINELVNLIKSISGVVNIRTKRADLGISVEGISLAVWNPVYEDLDFTIINADLQLPFFKAPYLYNRAEFIDQIEITTTSTAVVDATVTEF